MQFSDTAVSIGLTVPNMKNCHVHKSVLESKRLLMLTAVGRHDDTVSVLLCQVVPHKLFFTQLESKLLLLTAAVGRHDDVAGADGLA
jgi:hypothetical protein